MPLEPPLGEKLQAALGSPAMMREGRLMTAVHVTIVAGFLAINRVAAGMPQDPIPNERVGQVV
jgi:hypothetical protein